jgi:tRNA 2-thiouridine synthesizing protein A
MRGSGTGSAIGIWSKVIDDDLQKSSARHGDDESGAKPDHVTRQEMIRIDVRGRRCPIPTLRLSRALRKVAAGTIIELIADDPMARIDAPHFAAQAGHEVLTITEATGVLSIRVRKVES